METLVEQARRLSSGTIATLTNEKRYVVIDAIRADFVAFCQMLKPGSADTWQKAWGWFWQPICCREPKLRGGRCETCGEWHESPPELPQGDNEG